MAKPTKQGKGAGSKPKEGCKSQAQKAKKRGFQSRKRHASDGSDDDAVSSDPEGPSSRPKKKGKHVDISDKENEEEIDDAEDEVELVEGDQPESEPEPVSSSYYLKYRT
jgi:hypothetical protein